MTMRRLFAVIAALSVSGVSLADQCEQIIGGVKDISTGDITLDSRSSFKRYFCDRQWTEYRKAMCDSIATSASSYTSIKTVTQSANRQVVRAWATCVANPGFHFYAEANPTDPHVVTFQATFVPHGPPSNTTAEGPISWVPQDALTCPSGVINAGTSIDSGGKIVNCQRVKTPQST
jgi:hypothetical protein